MRKKVGKKEKFDEKTAENRDFKYCENSNCKRIFYKEPECSPYTWKVKKYCCRGCQTVPGRRHPNSVDSNGFIDAANEYQRKFRKRKRRGTKLYSCEKKKGCKKLSQEELWKLVPSAQPNYRSNTYGLQNSR